MEQTFYMTVRAMVAVYVLYRLYIVVYKKRLFGMRDYLFEFGEFLARKREPRTSEPVTTQKKTSVSVIGKTIVVYLKDPASSAVAPVLTEQLELTGYIGAEEDILSDEVESELTPPLEKVLDKDEFYERLDENALGEDPELSTGLTYQQLSQAVDVLTSSSLENKKVEEMMEVARTLYAIRGTDMFQFFASQVGNTAMIEQILEECLDGDGQPLTKREKKPLPNNTTTFDIERFV